MVEWRMSEKVLKFFGVNEKNVPLFSYYRIGYDGAVFYRKQFQ